MSEKITVAKLGKALDIFANHGAGINESSRLIIDGIDMNKEYPAIGRE